MCTRTIGNGERSIRIANMLHEFRKIKLTDGMPIKFRNGPEANDNAAASKIPMPTANSKAVDTEDSCFLSITPFEGLPLLPPSKTG